MNYRTKIGTAIATTSLLLGVYAPLAYADTTIEISGNGNNSTNNVTVTNNETTDINQTNNLTVTLNITSKANTGGNQANNNTGGDVTIDTGNATSNVSVNVEGGSNIANVPCGCLAPLDSVIISGNGNNSNNTSNLTNKKEKKAKQTNTASVGGSVKSKAKTGKNKSNGNTNGTVNVTTGNSNSTVDVNVTQPTNEVNVTP